MKSKDLDIEKIVNYCIGSSESNYSTMHNLHRSKDYDWALFVGHLVLEKLMKALYVKLLKMHPPYIHDLLRLADKMSLEVTPEQEEWLDTITTFNINARYDNYKLNFTKLCTKEFADIWMPRIESVREWIKKQL